MTSYQVRLSMDLWATKDHYEVENEESERLVRPAPKVRTPRHDLRRERMDTDRDPDIEGDPDIARDKDLSLNYKNVGGSTISRVVSRYLGYDPLALKVANRFVEGDLDRSDYVPVVNKETGESTHVKKETLKGPEGAKYKLVKEEDAAGEGGGDDSAKVQELAEKNPRLKGVLEALANPKHKEHTTFTSLLDHPLSKLLPDVQFPEGVKTVRDLQKIVQETPKTKPKGPDKAKKKAPPPAGAPEAGPKPAGAPVEPSQGGPPSKASPPRSLPDHEDLFGGPTPEAKDALRNFVKNKEFESPDFKAWADKQQTVDHDEEGKPLFGKKKVPFDKLSPAEQLKVKATFDEVVKLNKNTTALKELAEDPDTRRLLRDLGNPRSQLRERIDGHARENRLDLDQAIIRKTIPEAASLKLPAGFSSTQDLLDAAEKAFSPPGEPKRSKANKQETVRAEAAIHESLPEDLAKHVESMGLHPEDVSHLLSGYKAAMKTPLKGGDLTEVTQGLMASGGYHLDPEKIEPPLHVYEHGKKRKFEDLDPADQAEAFAQYKMHVLASSMAAREHITQSLKKQGLPEGPAKVISETMLKSGSRELSDETVQKFFRGSLQTSFVNQPIDDASVKKLVASVAHSPAAKKLVAAYVQASNYADAQNRYLSNDPRYGKTRITEWDSPKSAAQKLEEASEFLRKKSELLPADSRVVDTAMHFRNRVMDRLSTLAPEKVPAVRGYLSDYENETHQAKVEAAEEQEKHYQAALVKEKQLAKTEREGPDQGAYRSPGDTNKEPPEEEVKERLKKKGITPPTKPIPPPGYEHWKDRKKVEESSKSAIDWLKSLFSGTGKQKKHASLTVEQRVLLRSVLPTLRQRVAFRYEMGLVSSYSSYSGCWTMGQSSTNTRTAVYWGQEPYQDTAPYPGWTQAQARDFNDQDFDSILTAAREWLKMPVLSRSIAGLYPDTQFRAALDLALRDHEGGKYSAGVYPTVYDTLLAKLSSQPGPYELTTGVPEEVPGVKTAGYGYALEAKSYLFVTFPKKFKPFNIDVIRAIQKTFISGKGDDGKVHDDLMIHFMDDKTSGSLSHIEEKQGAQLETRVDVQIPKGAEAAATKAMIAIGKEFGFKVEPVDAGYKPKTRKPAGKSTYATMERGTIMKASAQVRSFAARTAQTTTDPELAFDLLALADKLAAEEQGEQAPAQQEQAQETEAQKQAAIKFAAAQVNKFAAVRTLVIRAAAQNPSLRDVFLPILQAVK